MTDVLKVLRDNTSPTNGITIIHTYCGLRTDRKFASAEEALAWIQKSIFDHIEQDMVADGIEMPTNVVGTLFFTVQRTSKPGKVMSKYE